MFDGKVALNIAPTSCTTGATATSSIEEVLLRL